MLLKIVSALHPQNCRDRIFSIIEALDVYHCPLSEGDSTWDRLLRESADIYLVHRSDIPALEQILDLDHLPEQPTIVVFHQDQNSEEHAKMMAAGIHNFLDLKLSDQLISEGLKSLIEHRMSFESEKLARMSIQEPRLSDFVSQSQSMRELLSVVERVVNSDASILILGETGVGKERLARAIHNDSQRSQGPFIAINCGGLPENLLESELFGHEKGAFTGAVRERKGCFELAHHGTIFLDEIGDMPLHLQVKLLRVLQERKIKRLGGEIELEVDVRVLSATNHDLEAEVESQHFRRDLFYRLSVISLTIPALKDRIQDLPELVKNYIKIFRYRLNKPIHGVTADALELMQQYTWPGNIRELVNAIERAMLLCLGDTITLDDLALKTDHLKSKVIEQALAPPEDNPSVEDFPDDWFELSYQELKQRLLTDFDVKYLTAILKKCHGRVGQASKMAGLQERSLFEKMRKMGLKKEDFRN